MDKFSSLMAAPEPGLFIGLLLMLYISFRAFSSNGGIKRENLLLVHSLLALSSQVLLLTLFLLDLSGVWHYLLYTLGFTQLLLALFTSSEESCDETSPRSASTGLASVIIIGSLSIVLITLFLFRNNDGLFTWETDVSRNFVKNFLEGMSSSSYFLRSLTWDDGLVSSSYHSLLYGAPTYVLLKINEFSPINLRLFSALYGVMSFVLSYFLVLKYFGPRQAKLCAAAFAFSPLLIYYSGYGVSLSATIFALNLALFFVFYYFQERNPSFFLLPFALAAMFLSTLAYSPARVVLLSFLALMGAVAGRRVWNKDYKATVWLLLLYAGCFGIYGIQYHAESARSLFQARGEQIFNFLEQPCWIADFMQVPCDDLNPIQVSPLQAVMTLLSETLVQLGRLLSPLTSQRHIAQGVLNLGDPPSLPLYHPVFFPFFLLGLGLSLNRPFQAKKLLAPVWLTGICVVLLFTSRVDVHRLSVLHFPICLLIAQGGCFLFDSLERSNSASKTSLRFTKLGFLFLLLLWCLGFLAAPSLKQSELVRRSLKELALIHGPVKIGMQIDHTERSLLNLQLAEKNRIEESQESGILPEEMMDKIAQASRLEDSLFQSLLDFRSQASLLIGPSERYLALMQALNENNIDYSLISSEQGDLVLIPSLEIAENR